MKTKTLGILQTILGVIPLVWIIILGFFGAIETWIISLALGLTITGIANIKSKK